MSKTQKFIVTILVISVLFTVLCFPVSAQYIGMLDFNLYYTTSTSTSAPIFINETGGAGEQLPATTGLCAMWALDSYDTGKTYTFEFNCTLNRNDIKLGTKKNLNLYHSPSDTITLSSSSTLSKAYYSCEFNPDTRQLKFTVKVNTDLTDLGGFPIYLYLYQALSTQYLAITTNAWSTYAEVDAGGAEYIQTLVEEVSQMRQNDETYHSSALQTLNEIKKNSDKLPNDIKQILEERDQQEKQEGMTQTEEGIASITESLTNLIPVSSVIDSIKPIYNACTYDGKQSIWTLPSITIPKIEGVIEETAISSEKQFDMVEYANRFIPNDLISLARSVNGIGIVIFSIYEVVSLINQVINGNFIEKENDEE